MKREGVHELSIAPRLLLVIQTAPRSLSYSSLAQLGAGESRPFPHLAALTDHLFHSRSYIASVTVLQKLDRSCSWPHSHRASLRPSRSGKAR